MSFRKKFKDKNLVQNIKSQVFLQFVLIFLVILCVILLTSASLYTNIITGITLSNLRDAIEVTKQVDVSRYSAKVISGIGFLGAGTIIVTGRQEIKGLTTAAGLWASACMGLAIGSGYYECAILGFLLILLTTIVFEKISSWVISNARNMDLYVEFEKIENLGEIINTFKEMNIQIFDVDIQREKQSNGVTIGAVISSRLPKKETHSNVMSRISKFDFVTVVDEI